MAESLFGSCSFERATLGNEQVLDLDGLKGRLFSTSYVPAKGEPGSEEMLREAEKLFRKHEADGAVNIEYDTRAYYGRLNEGEHGSLIVRRRATSGFPGQPRRQRATAWTAPMRPV